MKVSVLLGDCLSGCDHILIYLNFKYRDSIPSNGQAKPSQTLHEEIASSFFSEVERKEVEKEWREPDRERERWEEKTIRQPNSTFSNFFCILQEFTLPTWTQPWQTIVNKTLAPPPPHPLPYIYIGSQQR